MGKNYNLVFSHRLYDLVERLCHGLMESDYILRNGTVECNCVLRYIVIQAILILSCISL
jgi:hypothetical protein